MQLSADWIGWLATAIFLVSYSCKNQGQLRRVQSLAAVLWVAYGVILHAVPIVVANLLVAGVALYSSLGGSLAARRPARKPAEAAAVTDRKEGGSRREAVDSMMG